MWLYSTWRRWTNIRWFLQRWTVLQRLASPTKTSPAAFAQMSGTTQRPSFTFRKDWAATFMVQRKLDFFLIRKSSSISTARNLSDMIVYTYNLFPIDWQMKWLIDCRNVSLVEVHMMHRKAESCLPLLQHWMLIAPQGSWRRNRQCWS